MISLTRQERQVILFLTTVAFLGTGINFLLKKCSPVKNFLCFTQEIGKINLNQADKEMLESVSGIGEKLAQRIIEYRKQNDKFSELEELKKIKGISDDKFEKLKNSFLIK